MTTIPRGSLAALLGLLLWTAAGGALLPQEPPSSAGPEAAAAPRAADAGVAAVGGPAAEGTTEGAPPAAPEKDPAADFFLSRCSGCHTVGGGRLTGPDLETATGWPAADLTLAVERMEKNVGPMTGEQVAALVGLLEDRQVQERLSRARERQVQELAATLEPPSARRGDALFHGRTPLAGGGLPCAACHRAGGAGGNFAKDLDGAFERLGRSALVSAAEKPGFPLMAAAYRRHPVTRQEAVDLVEYLASRKGEEPPAETAGLPPVGKWGAVGAALVLVALGLVYRRRNRGVRARLVAASLRK